MQISNHAELKKWVTTKEASDHLKVSESSLYQYRKRNLLKAGKDWRRKFPDSASSAVLYDIAQCERTLQEEFASNAETLELVRV